MSQRKKPPAKPPAKRSRSRKKQTHAEMSREEYLVSSLGQVESAVTEATGAGSWQAVINGKRLAMQVREDLDAYRKENATQDISTEEAIKRIRDAIHDWPDELLEHAVDVYSGRHEAQVMLIREGNKVRREAGGWRGA